MTGMSGHSSWRSSKVSWMASVRKVMSASGRRSRYLARYQVRRERMYSGPLAQPRSRLSTSKVIGPSWASHSVARRLATSIAMAGSAVSSGMSRSTDFPAGRASWATAWRVSSNGRKRKKTVRQDMVDSL